MTEKVPIRVQMKRMHSVAWRSSDVILYDGELGVESDTGKVKVGDGESRFSDLKYLTGPQGEKGQRGEQGDPGDSITIAGQEALDSGDVKVVFSDDTEVVLKRGPEGPRGETGETGPRGQQGQMGERGPKGESFTYDDFTPDQLEALRGPEGKPATVESVEQLESGNTQITFSDGKIAEIQKGQDGSVRFENLSDEQLRQVLANILAEKSDVGHTHSEYLTEVPERFADKKYVDTKVDNIEIPEVDLSKYATTEQVSEAIGGIDFGDYLTSIPDNVVRTDAMQTYVSEQINAIPDVDLSGYIKESNADSRYAPVNHTHSQYITSIPDDLARKQYVDDAVEAKANLKLVQQLQTKIEELERKVQTLESRSGKVKNINNNRWLDVGIYPNGRLPSNSTNRLLFEEE